MICAYLLYRDRYKDADEVLNFYGQKRTFNSKVGPAAVLFIYFCFSFLVLTSCLPVFAGLFVTTYLSGAIVNQLTGSTYYDKYTSTFCHICNSGLQN